MPTKRQWFLAAAHLGEHLAACYTGGSWPLCRLGITGCKQEAQYLSIEAGDRHNYYCTECAAQKPEHFNWPED